MSFHTKIYLLLLGYFTLQAHAQNFAQMEEIQLSVPIAHYASTLFEDSVALHFSPTYLESTIHYTTNGSEPTEKSPVFSQKQYLHKNTLIKAAAFHPDLQTSPISSINFVKVSSLKGVKSIKLLTTASEKYKGQGAKSLIDLQKGTLDFRENTWMGFAGGEVVIRVDFKKRRKVEKIRVSTMVNHRAWIFLPESIQVRSKHCSFTANWEMPQSEEVKRLEYLTIALNGIKTKQLYIHIKNATAIPDWHSGAGTPPWFFIDEIIIGQ